jgi:flagellar basal body rod protein FlgF
MASPHLTSPPLQATAAAAQLRTHLQLAEESVRAVGGANAAVAGFRAQLEAQLQGMTQQAEGTRTRWLWGSRCASRLGHSRDGVMR